MHLDTRNPKAASFLHIVEMISSSDPALDGTDTSFSYKTTTIKVTNSESSLQEHVFGNRGSGWSRCRHLHLHKLDDLIELPASVTIEFCSSHRSHDA